MGRVAPEVIEMTRVSVSLLLHNTMIGRMKYECDMILYALETEVTRIRFHDLYKTKFVEYRRTAQISNGSSPC